MALLTARVAAERLGVGYSTLKRWVRNGRVRTTRTEGGHHRVAEAEIDRLLAPHQPSARSQQQSPEHNQTGAPAESEEETLEQDIGAVSHL